MPTFGAKLKELREARGLTLRELAEKAGMNLYSIAKLEQEVREPAFASVQALCGALGVKCSAFEGTTPAEKNATTKKPGAKAKGTTKKKGAPKK